MSTQLEDFVTDSRFTDAPDDATRQAYLQRFYENRVKSLPDYATNAQEHQTGFTRAAMRLTNIHPFNPLPTGPADQAMPTPALSPQEKATLPPVQSPLLGQVGAYGQTALETIPDAANRLVAGGIGGLGQLATAVGAPSVGGAMSQKAQDMEQSGQIAYPHALRSFLEGAPSPEWAQRLGATPTGVPGIKDALPVSTADRLRMALDPQQYPLTEPQMGWAERQAAGLGDLGRGLAGSFMDPTVAAMGIPGKAGAAMRALALPLFAPGLAATSVQQSQQGNVIPALASAIFTAGMLKGMRSEPEAQGVSPETVKAATEAARTQPEPTAPPQPEPISLRAEAAPVPERLPTPPPAPKPGVSVPETVALPPTAITIPPGIAEAGLQEAWLMAQGRSYNGFVKAMQERYPDGFPNDAMTYAGFPYWKDFWNTAAHPTITGEEKPLEKPPSVPEPLAENKPEVKPAEAQPPSISLQPLTPEAKPVTPVSAEVVKPAAPMPPVEAPKPPEAAADPKEMETERWNWDKVEPTKMAAAPAEAPPTVPIEPPKPSYKPKAVIEDEAKQYEADQETAKVQSAEIDKRINRRKPPTGTVPVSVQDIKAGDKLTINAVPYIASIDPDTADVKLTADDSQKLVMNAELLDKTIPGTATTIHPDSYTPAPEGEEGFGEGAEQATEPVTPPEERAGKEPAGGEERILGFGGSEKRVAAKSPNEIPVATTPKQVEDLQNTKTPGLLDSALGGVRSLLLPSSKGPESLRAAEKLGGAVGEMNRGAESASAQLEPASRAFDKLGVHNEKIPLAQNVGVKFMSDMSQGRPVESRFKAAADVVQKMFSDRLTKLAEVGSPLQHVLENYFPGMWTRDSRVAFNAAIENAKAERRIAEDFDVNTATPQQKAAIKAEVDKNLKAGKGSDNDMLSYLTRKPMKGKESFRKEKVFDDIMTGVEFGLRPFSNNPIDLVKLKLAELDKSIAMTKYFDELKSVGKEKVISPYEKVPTGWVKLNDKYGTIFGKPTVNVNEYVDKGVYDGLMKFAKGLGITPERVASAGRGKLGYASTSGKTVSQANTELSVLAHELGHQLDFKYDLWDKMVQGVLVKSERSKKGNPTVASLKQRAVIGNELRALSDLSWEGKAPSNYYKEQVRKKPEKMAHLLEAYIHAPERFQEVAPTVFKNFDDFIMSKPELKGLADIKQGLALEKLTSEKYVGLPIMGYRIVPEAEGEIINNYLSSSLYNNRYFGGGYRAWIGTANALNQSQLGLGSAFHAGFTTGDVQVSAGANVIKDIFGLVKGNRSPLEFANTLKTYTVSSVKTAMTGDKFLNAWNNPDGVIDPRMAQLVKAGQLAGTGFKMEKGLMTEQATKVRRDWYSGHQLRALARSPVGLTEIMARPIMEYLVPRQKAGVFAELAGRIIEQNPGIDLETLRPEFRQASNRVDARLGQVQYTRLFANNTAKNVVQALVRAPGWTGGTIAEIGGAFPDAAKFMADWVKTGRMPDDIPDRVAYTMSLLAHVCAANAIATYAFTGQMPRGLDYFAFRTGKKDKDGNDERFLFPSYVKDILAYSQNVGGTLINKSHPLIGMLVQVYNNRDYYGTEIRTPTDPLSAQAAEVSKYVVKQFEPFWTRGARKAMEVNTGPGRAVAAYSGIVPASKRLTNSPAENMAEDLFSRRNPSGTKTRDEADAAARHRDLIKKMRAGEELTAEDWQKSGITSEHQARALVERAQKTPLTYFASRLSADDVASVYRQANAEEKKILWPILAKKRANKGQETTEEEP